MGVKGLWQLLEAAGRPVTLESLEGKVLAVDVSIWLNKAAKGMRDKFGNPVHNGHLLLMFHRICKLLFYKIKPIFVFDGGVPELKKKTLAARKDRRLEAQSKAGKAREKMLQNYIKNVALGVVTGKKSSGIRGLQQKQEPDLFELPPMSMESQTDSSSDELEGNEEDDSLATSMRSDHVQEMFQDTNQIDFESEDFQKLPPEVQHELLVELKEAHRRKYNKSRSFVMPEEAEDFSSFQLAGLLRRGQITKQINDLRQDMSTKSSGDIMQMYSVENNECKKEVEAKRVVSEPKGHYILIKSVGGRGGNVMFAGEQGERTGEATEEMLARDDFQRLEREPHQFKEMYFDDVLPANFMSDSSDESTLVSPRQNISFKFPTVVRQSDEKKSMQKEEGISTSTHSSHNKSVRLENEKTNECADVVDTVDKGTFVSEISSNAEISTSDTEMPRTVLVCTENKESEETVQENECDRQPPISFGKQPTFILRGYAQPEKDFSLFNEENVNKSTATLEETVYTLEENVTRQVNRQSTDAINKRTVVPAAEYLAEGDQQLEEKDSGSHEIEAVESVDDLKDTARGDKTTQRPKLNEEEIKRIKEFQRSVEGKTKDDLTEMQEDLAKEQRELQRERQKLTRAATSVLAEMYNDVQELLRLFGIPFLISPMEAEAQCARLDTSGQCDGSITDDSDIFLFGGKRVYKNIFNPNKYAEYYSINEIKSHLLLDRFKMIALAYLTGSDYTEGIHGVGGVTALEMLQEFPGEPLETLAMIRTWYDQIENQVKPTQETKVKSKMRTLKLPAGFPNHQVWDAYIYPTVDSSDEPFEWGTADLGSIREFARDKFNWRSSQTDEILLPVLKKWNSKETQSKMTSLFPRLTTAPKKSSKRIQRVLNLIRSGQNITRTTDNNSENLDGNTTTGVKARNGKKRKMSLTSKSLAQKMPTAMSCQSMLPEDTDYRDQSFGNVSSSPATLSTSLPPCKRYPMFSESTDGYRGAMRRHTASGLKTDQKRTLLRDNLASSGAAPSRGKSERYTVTKSKLRGQAGSSTGRIGKNFTEPVDRVCLSSESESD